MEIVGTPHLPPLVMTELSYFPKYRLSSPVDALTRLASCLNAACVKNVPGRAEIGIPFNVRALESNVRLEEQ